MISRYLIPLVPSLLALMTSCNTTRGTIYVNAPSPSEMVEPTHVAEYRVVRDVTYTPASWNAGSLADIWIPAAEGPFPAVLMVHGGGWKGGDNRWQMKWYSKALVKRGYVVVNVTYRQLPDWTYPAPLEDLREALHFMRDHATEYEIDPQRIGAWGYSAGGHLVSLLGSFEGSGANGLRCLVLGGAPEDLRAWPERPLIVGFMGGGYERIPERWAHASPVTHAGPQTPPTFFYHGTDDTTVTTLHVTEMREIMDRNDVDSEILWIRGKGHVGTWNLNEKERSRVIDYLDRNLRDSE